MKLLSPFVQLPLMFDAQRLAQEVGRMDQSAWLPHPQGFPGNDFLPLVSVRGDPNNDNFQGPMRATPFLEQCPYLIDVLASLGVSLGRTRLMRLLGHAEVTPHVDVHYYWRERMRVHVPIVTQPTVRFICGPQEVNMKEGECWIFDTWSKHRVINDAERARIHLVVDTVGGEQFWDLATRGRVPGQPQSSGWSARAVAPFGASIARLDFENNNIPKVMSPWEVRDHTNFLLSEADPNQPAFAATAQAIHQFHHSWRSLWSTFGESHEGWPRYRRALDLFVAALRAARTETLQLRNAYPFSQALNAAVIGVALADREQDDGAGESRDSETTQAPNPAPAAPSINPGLAGVDGSDAFFDRPVFIVNPPRSGSSALFETLANAPNVYTVGGESHEIIEGMAALNIAARQWSSNRLDAEDATPEIVAELRTRFASALRDRHGARPSPGGRVRMLEKTPKNALRVPFLAAAFPEAHFIYLYRDPREVLASMMEAWSSGKFRTYMGLPNWRGELAWSMLLTPGWSDLAALPLNERVAAQWATATTILLNDLSALPQHRWSVARYHDFVRDPATVVRDVCETVGFDWDRPIGSTLPLSRHTVSKPRPDKWREHEAEIEAAMRKVADVAARAERLAAR